MTVSAPPTPRVAVVVCAYTLERLDQLTACLESLHRQLRPPESIVCVIDHNDLLLRTVRQLAVERSWDLTEIVPNGAAQGLSGARNSGVAATVGDLVVFVDDDAVPDAEWLAELVAPFEIDGVAAVGGHIEPGWPHGRPWWFPPHLDWTVGCSIPTLPTEVAPIRNMYGASAAFRRDALEVAEGFPTELGRVGKNGAGCEETEVCLRIAERIAGSSIVHAPRSRVVHHVPDDRVRVRYVVRRCLAEGRSKATLSRRVGAASATSDERRYVGIIALAVGTDLAGAVLRPSRLGRAVVLLAGLAAAAIGYADGSLRSR